MEWSFFFQDAQIKIKIGDPLENDSDWTNSKDERSTYQNESRVPGGIPGRSMNRMESSLIDHDDPRMISSRRERGSTNEKQARCSDDVELNKIKELFSDGKQQRWPKSDEEPWVIKGEVPVWEENIQDEQ